MQTAKKRLWGFRIFLDNCTVGVDKVYDLKHSWVVSLDSETGVLINFQMKIQSIEIGKREGEESGENRWEREGKGRVEKWGKIK